VTNILNIFNKAVPHFTTSVLWTLTCYVLHVHM